MSIKVEMHADGSASIEIQANEQPTIVPRGTILVSKDLWELVRLILDDLEDLEQAGCPIWPCMCSPRTGDCLWCSIGVRVREMKRIRGPRI